MMLFVVPYPYSYRITGGTPTAPFIYSRGISRAIDETSIGKLAPVKLANAFLYIGFYFFRLPVQEEKALIANASKDSLSAM